MIYLDYAATTPVAPEVFAAMRTWLEPGAGFGNPSSTHAAGLRARAAVEQARAQAAALIGAEAREIIWTSGATESNNLAIKGAIEFSGAKAAHVLTSRIEHRCVLDTCRWLETRGVAVTYLKPDAQGRIANDAVLANLRPETLLVSLMWVNNETGVIQDIEDLAPRLRMRGVLLHVDAVQAVARLDIDLRRTPIDLLSLSAHKIYGPQGAGALYVRRKPRARLAPQLHGGGHEWGMRSGTLATHQIVGMGAACARLSDNWRPQALRLAALRERLWSALCALPRIHRNGEAAQAAPHLLNVSFEGVDGEALRAGVSDLALASGSACSSATAEPSYVLRALGRDDALADASLRFSFGEPTTDAEIDCAATRVCAEVQRLRALSPLESTTSRILPAPALERPPSYSERVWRLFQETPRAGRFFPGIEGLHSGEAASVARRGRLRLECRFDNERVLDSRFLALGCPVQIAVAAWLAQWAIGRHRTELGGLRAAAIAEALEIGDDRIHCALMGEDAVQALVADPSPT